MSRIGVSDHVAEPRSERSVGYHEGKCWGAAGESTERWQTDPNENHACMVCGMTGCRKIMKDKESTRAEAGHTSHVFLTGANGFSRHGETKRMTRAKKSPVLIGDRAGGHSLRLHSAIPRWVAPQQSPTPFHQAPYNLVILLRPHKHL